MTLLSSCGAFRWDPARPLSPLDPRGGRLLQFEGSAQDQVIQDSGLRLFRTRRHQQLVRTQPHLVHNMAAPEIEESSGPKAGGNRSSSLRSQEDQNLQVEEEMEVRTSLTPPAPLRTPSRLVLPFQRTVHLGDGPEVYGGAPRSTEADKELLNGQEDESREVSGFNGGDVEEREWGEEGGESQEPRGRDGGGGAPEANPTVPDLDSLIGQSHWSPLASVSALLASPLTRLSLSQATRYRSTPEAPASLLRPGRRWTRR